MTVKKVTWFSKIKTQVPTKLKTLKELSDKLFIEEMTDIDRKEVFYLPRMLAFEFVNEIVRRRFAYGLIGKLLFELRDLKRQGSADGLDGVVVDDLEAVLALDFRKYIAELRPVYVTWINQAYPTYGYPLIVSEEAILSGKYEDAKKRILAIPANEIEAFEDVGHAWNEELRARGLDEYILKRKPAPKIAPQTTQTTQPLRAAKPPMFAFMHDQRLRSFIERDFKDLQQARLWASLRLRFVLAGGLIEGLLLDALRADGSAAHTVAGKREGKPIEYWSLGSLLEAASELQLIGGTVAKLASPVRELRNFVHPGVEWRSNLPVEREEVEIVERILDIEIRDLSRQRNKIVSIATP